MPHEPAQRPRRALTRAGVTAKNAAKAAGEPYLELRAGNDDDLQIVRLPQDRSQISIGRNDQSDVSLFWDGQVSWAHARLERLDGEWMVEDLGSTNGSFVNRTPLMSRRRLTDGDRLRFGDTYVVFQDSRPARPPKTVRSGAIPSDVALTERQREVLIALCRPLNDDPDCVTPATRCTSARTP